MRSKSFLSASSRKACVAVMVLGSAFGLGSSAASAREAAPDTVRAISDMSRYCTTCWRNARLQSDCWSDCTQEVFGRLLERVPADSWERVLADEGMERKEFLRAIDMVKKRVQRSRKASDSDLDSIADVRVDYSQDLAERREEVKEAADTLLTARQQSILKRSFEGWSVQEIARDLRLSAHRVSDEKYKAIRKLRRYLADAI
jgi:RNA polymerase sigma factor (sigma-70 family)